MLEAPSVVFLPAVVERSVKDLEAELAELDARHAKIAAEIDELADWTEDLYGELETILALRDGIRERLARLTQPQLPLHAAE